MSAHSPSDLDPCSLGIKTDYGGAEALMRPRGSHTYSGADNMHYRRLRVRRASFMRLVFEDKRRNHPLRSAAKHKRTPQTTFQTGWRCGSGGAGVR